MPCPYRAAPGGTRPARLARRRTIPRRALTTQLATTASTIRASTVICAQSGRKPRTASKTWVLAEASGTPVYMDRPPLPFRPPAEPEGY
ncbi:hypothetical protein SVIOM342S_07680 [Streptomyces violaceorubidus]